MTKNTYTNFFFYLKFFSSTIYSHFLVHLLLYLFVDCKLCYLSVLAVTRVEIPLFVCCIVISVRTDHIYYLLFMGYRPDMHLFLLTNISKHRRSPTALNIRCHYGLSGAPPASSSGHAPLRVRAPVPAYPLLCGCCCHSYHLKCSCRSDPLKCSCYYRNVSS